MRRPKEQHTIGRHVDRSQPLSVGMCDALAVDQTSLHHQATQRVTYEDDGSFCSFSYAPISREFASKVLSMIVEVIF